MIVGRMLFGCDERVAQFVTDILGECLASDSFRAIGVLSENRSSLIAGVVYHSFTGPNIAVDIASTSPKWCRKPILKSLFDYPFEQLGCRRITSIVSEENAKSIRFTEGLGFRREGVMREGGKAGRDAFLYGLLRSERRY